jgi:hypothetical protein
LATSSIYHQPDWQHNPSITNLIGNIIVNPDPKPFLSATDQEL